MQIIKNKKGNQVIIFAQTFEQEAFDQVKKLANYEPYMDARIRIMPDAHAGKGCTVGTTMTITDKITPNLVGVDIGCGMLTLTIKDPHLDFEKLDRIIKTNIPHGFGIHNASQKEFDFSGLRCQRFVDLSRAHLSIGTLGGGNHFIEVGKSQQTGRVYMVIHSGSRKLGTDVCKHYQERAIAEMGGMATEKQILVQKLKARGKQKEIDKALKKLQQPVMIKELAFLSGAGFDDYMNDMAIVQRFASINREIMAEIIMKSMGWKTENRFETIHNYIDFKRMILRKGAVSAEKGETLLIPINMRDGSLLCKGKGNENWNYSAPHGAGRLMSRSKAKQILKVNDFVESMQGIYTSTAGANTLDEAPQAYKSIHEIIPAITETAEIIETIKPLYNFKAQ
jgi:tRNA-splicing ligase RtcB (3'-phosphate/5'-hydroxy nucleic acid ligase)